MSATAVDTNIEDQLLEEELAQRPMDGSLLRRLLSYLWPYRRVVIGTVAGVTLAVASQLLGPRFIQYGIDHYLINFKTPAEALRGIALVSGVYLLNLLLGWGAGVLRVRACVAAGQGALRDLRGAIFKHVQRLSLNYFDKTHQGRIIARADTDITAIEPILEDGTHQALGSVLTLIGVIAFMLHYDWRLFLAVAVVLPPLAFATMLFQRHGMRAYREVRRYSSRLTAAMAENISGVRVVQAFAREDRNRDRFAGMHAAYGERAYVAATVFHTYFPFLGLMSGMGSVIILGYGGTLALRGEITPGELAAFLMYLGMFFGPVQTMGELYNQALSSAAGAERIFQLLDERPQVRDATDAVTLPPLRGEVAFEDVSFRYDTTPADRWILEDVSLRAAAGATVALVGQTGSGKTSIVSLLARFYEPQRGRVLVDGIDLRRATAESLREQIGIVTQENFMFSGTVMENLRFGRPEATDEEVFEAARTLGTDTMIRGMEKGYETVVAERGGNFSAGERQLLCFTRAMVARPRILILDEATSAVDPGTEAIIQNALERLFARRTSFVIAHRLSTIRHADEILVMADGRIVERGTHAELLTRPDGEYRKLHAEFSQH